MTTAITVPLHRAKSMPLGTNGSDDSPSTAVWGTIERVPSTAVWDARGASTALWGCTPPIIPVMAQRPAVSSLGQRA
jgi:hypothetical protein